MELRAEQGEHAGQVFRPEHPVVTVGRAQGNDILLQEQGVSRHHARLQRGSRGWILSDLGSGNGTFVNGRRLAAQEGHVLRSGDRITIGSSVLSFREAEGEGGRDRAGSPVLAHPAARILGAVLFVAVLVGIVALLVILLQPGEQTAAPTPTRGNPVDLLVTALPVPTELEGIVTAVVPLLPSGLPLFPAAPTATPDPSGDSVQGGFAQGEITDTGP